MKTAELFDKYYFARPDFATGVGLFQDLLRHEIQSGAKVLEIGAGPSNAMSQFIAERFRTEGVDMSEEVLGNEFLECARVYDGGVLPYESESFDACVSY